MDIRDVKKIELLAPAKNLECGLAAINHGADAVYIGAPKFGARKSAANSMKDIESLAKYGRKYGAEVYITLNTILKDSELKEAEMAARQAWDSGVSAIIIQDMAFMEMDLPPLRIFASTQTDNRTVEKVLFLENAGFDRVILARELQIGEIRKIRENTTVDLEAFVHGAVCYSYSGRCYLSAFLGGRSANRGECGQPCRLKWDLKKTTGDSVLSGKHLLSPKDMDRSDYLEDLIDAGVTSFKIEGRLKDADYVKNITSFYRKKLDALFEKRRDYRPSSSGKTVFFFDPDPEKTFNRGLHSFFFEKEIEPVFSSDTPKSMGKAIGSVRKKGADFIETDYSDVIRNGDGLCFISKDGNLAGFQVEKTDGRRIYPGPDIIGIIEKGIKLYRNRDHVFLRQLSNGKTSERKIAVDFLFYEYDQGFILKAEDEDGVNAEISMPCEKIPAEKPDSAHSSIIKHLSKLGDSLFTLRELKIESAPYFIQVKFLNCIRRDIVSLLEEKRSGLSFSPEPRRFNNKAQALFYENQLDYSANVSNEKAKDFYRKCGVQSISPCFEAAGGGDDSSLMHSKHCILKGTERCFKVSGDKTEFVLEGKGGKFLVVCDCRKCEMHLKQKL